MDVYRIIEQLKVRRKKVPNIIYTVLHGENTCQSVFGFLDL